MAARAATGMAARAASMMAARAATGMAAMVVKTGMLEGASVRTGYLRAALDTAR
jgi:hypothetical protein